MQCMIFSQCSCEAPLRADEQGFERSSRYDIVIVGGGFSGTALAIQLLRQSVGELSIAIINRAGLPGRGVAYSTNYDDHLLNVGAGQMSAIPSEPADFLRWLALKRQKAVQPDEYVPRRLYGQYLEDTLTQARNNRPLVTFSWLKEHVISLALKANEPFLALSNGVDLRGKFVVLATGNAPPSSPPEVQSITERFYSPYAWADDALEGIADSGSVLILGSGLTAIDQIVALRARKFRGRIFLLSPRGHLPAAHSTATTWPSSWINVSANSVCGLFKSVRQQIKLASASGIDWQAVIDSIRPQSQLIWHRWPEEERERFLRHVRGHWEVSRHRVPKTIRASVTDLIADGSLHLIAGRLVKVIEYNCHVEAQLCERGTQKQRTLSVDRIINCTGPANFRRVQDRLVLSLLKDGFARLDPLQIGIDTAPDGSLISISSEPSDCIFTIGPVRKARLWETTAVAEIREQAVLLADHLLTRLNARE